MSPTKFDYWYFKITHTQSIMSTSYLLNNIIKTVSNHPYEKKLSGCNMSEIMNQTFNDSAISTLFQQLTVELKREHKSIQGVIDLMFSEMSQSADLSSETLNVLKELECFFNYSGTTDMTFSHNITCLQISILLSAKKKNGSLLHTIEKFSNSVRDADTRLVKMFAEIDENRRLSEEQWEIDRKLADEKLIAEQRLADDKLELEKRQSLKELFLEWKSDWKNVPITARLMTYGFESTVLVDIILETVAENVAEELRTRLFVTLITECDILIKYLKVQLETHCLSANDPYEAKRWATTELSAYESFKRALSK